MLEHTIYKNPLGWAKKLAGTRRRYLLSSFLTVLAGALLFYFSVSGSGETWLTTVSSVMVFVCAVELPLYYLRALRALLKERVESRTATLSPVSGRIPPQNPARG